MSAPSGRTLLKTLKEYAAPYGPSLSLLIGCPVEAVLRPVATHKGSLNVNDVRVLTEWRNRFVRAFLTEFEADESRTARWLTEIVGPDETRILFMVDDARNQTIGYMGLAFIDWGSNSGEADAIVRGGEAPPGLMSRAMRTMLDWARVQLGLRTLGVRVRSDNEALNFYHKFGFRETYRAPLRRTEREDMVYWVEDDSLPPGEPSLVHMLLPDEHKTDRRFEEILKSCDRG
jgi:RimJ/RimL family protein N-acetyltransferase